MNEQFVLRTAQPGDETEAAEIEKICFDPAEACSPESMAERVNKAPDCFLLLVDEDNKKIAGLIDGIATDGKRFSDEVLEGAKLHDPSGKNVMIAGVEVRPEYRGHGYAVLMMNEYISRQKKAGKSKLILTCHDYLVGFYKRFGFYDNGISDSVWGDMVWHEMILEIN